jgi:hypothetical protein
MVTTVPYIILHCATLSGPHCSTLQAQVHTVVGCSTLFSSSLFHAVCYCSIPVPRCLLLFYSVPRCSIGPHTVPHCSALFFHSYTLFHTVPHSLTLFYSVQTILLCPYCSTLFVQCSALNYIVQLWFIMLYCTVDLLRFYTVLRSSALF